MSQRLIALKNDYFIDRKRSQNEIATFMTVKPVAEKAKVGVKSRGS